ncbi:glycosyltransferase family 9 protein [Chloroflexia bacterium SDU3-3]|nr:glycosyltransferase family 9 protein [Chloroflexia bacterium SDU3-3]
MTPSPWRRAQIAAGSLGLFARTVARSGPPRVVLSFVGGVGDQLMCTAVLRELRRRGGRGLWMLTGAPELFAGSDDVDAVLPANFQLARLARAVGARVVEPRYATYVPEEDRDDIPPGHFIATMCRQAGLAGEVALRPYLRLAEAERAAGRLAPGQIVMQSSGLAGRYPMANKEWLPERMQAVAAALAQRHPLVQVGMPSDTPLPGAIDMRGKTSARQMAALLSQARLFIGIAGFPMHLARAVECRSVVVVGGRENPAQGGYGCNENLFSPEPCAPCWKKNDCPYDRRCMRAIEVGHVLAAVDRALARAGEPLEVGHEFL